MPILRSLPFAGAVLLAAALLALEIDSAPTPQFTPPVIVFVPLDERFATRGLFLNLAKVASPRYRVVTPPEEMISKLHRPADLPGLDGWLEDMLPGAHTLIVSLEMFVYGGLIASRESNSTLADVSARARALCGFKGRYPGLRVYASSVVMRIPAYNGAFEEPWYWEDYGEDLWQYSYHTSRYQHLNESTDQDAAQHYQSLIPSNVLEQFTWRRSRNANVSLVILDLLGKPSPDESGLSGTAPLDAFFVTEDDSASFGFNVDEADRLRATIAFLGLDQDTVRVYPGADEVQSAMLSRAAVADRRAHKPAIAAGLQQVVSKGGAPAPAAARSWELCASVVYRVPGSSRLIPNYESQNLSATVHAQVEAAGAVLCEDYDDYMHSTRPSGTFVHNNRASSSRRRSGRLLVLVSNFEASPQLEASQQPRPANTSDASLAAQFAEFDTALAACDPNQGDVLALADSRYSNGGDLALAAWIRARLMDSAGNCLTRGMFSYAGWNTDGNTLGTAIANGVLLRLFGPSRASARFTLLRLVEDLEYQAVVRQVLISFVDVSLDSVNDLAVDLDFYARFTLKPLAARTEQWADLIKLDGGTGGGDALVETWYPWNRTFEIGLALADDGGGDVLLECDVVVAGGSTSALASALAAADELSQSGPSAGTVCLTEPTDWVGGQLTSSLVTAPDFGHWNSLPANLPFEFVKLLDAVGFGATSPGQCWVSEACFEARSVLERFVVPALAKRPNLKVLLNTVVKEVAVDPIDGWINAVDVIRRTPRSSPPPAARSSTVDQSAQRTPASSNKRTAGGAGNSNRRSLRGVKHKTSSLAPNFAIDNPLSSGASVGGIGAAAAATSYASDRSDWYSEADSASFTKERIRLVRSVNVGGGASSDTSGRLVVVDGSELGDVLVLSSSFGGGWTQGYDDDEPASGRSNVDDDYFYASGGNRMAGNDILVGSDDVSGVVDTCGQAVVFPHYLELLDPSSPRAQKVPPTAWGPVGFGADYYSLGNFTLSEVWTYRRAHTDIVPAPPGPPDSQGKVGTSASVVAGLSANKAAAAMKAAGLVVASPAASSASRATPSGSQLGGPAAVGDVSLTAWGAGKGDGNDYPFGYHLLSAADTMSERETGDWRGGVNGETLEAAQAYSLGFASWLHEKIAAKAAAGVEPWTNGLLRLDTARAGTLSGLSKMPYVRDTRRAIGVGGFRLRASDLTTDPAAPPLGACVVCAASGGCDAALGSSGVSGRRFPGEEVALGNYFYFDTHALDPAATGCPPPTSLPDEPVAPYYVPFSALTVGAVGNLLVCGKTMAQSYSANAATRLHPVEWATGAAAGVAAALMAGNGGSSSGTRGGSSGSGQDGAQPSTSDVLASQELLDALRSAIEERHAPLEWAACPVHG